MQLYAIERAEQHGSIQLNVGAVGAGLAYGVPIGALLLSRCSYSAGCDGIGDGVLLVVPLPSLGLLGFLLANYALMERRARYMEALEEELARQIPAGEEQVHDEAFPFFVRSVLTQVYGQSPSWYMRATALLWALISFIIMIALCVIALAFVPSTAIAWVARALYVLPLLVLLLCALETAWLSTGAPRPSRLASLLTRVAGRAPAPHVDTDAGRRSRPR